MLHLKKAIHTRCLSDDQAVIAIRCTLPWLLNTLEKEVAEKDDAVARRLLHAMKCYKFEATIYLLSDALPLLSKLNLIFPKENIDLCVVKPVVNATLASLKVVCDKPGAYLKQLDKTIGTLSTEFGLRVSDNLKQQFQQNIRETYIDKLMENLQEMFVESDVLVALVTLSHHGNTGNSMQSSTSSFGTYGDAAADTLGLKVPHYSG